MASYAYFESDFTSDTFQEFIQRFFMDCYCMAEVYEGFMVELDNGRVIKIYMKDLERSVVGPEFFRIIIRDGKDFVIKYDNIVYLEIFPPDPSRW